MITNVYSIFDRKSSMAAYAPPFLADNDGLAQRNLIQALQQKSQLTQFPEDFTLVCVGQFDLEFGRLIPPTQGVNRIICQVLTLIQAGAGQLDHSQGVAPGAAGDAARAAGAPPQLVEALRVAANGAQ